MPARTYKLIELVGVSDVGVDDAIKNALSRAGQTLKGLDWFQVTETRGVLHEGQVTFQVRKLSTPVRPIGWAITGLERPPGVC